MDMIDLKPHAPVEIRSPFQPIKTSIPGVVFGEHLTRLSGILDKYSLIRTLVGTKNRHESFQCYTGRPGGRSRDGDNEPEGGWPSLGSVISKLQGPAPGHVPAYFDAGPKMSYGPYNNSGIHDASAVISWPGFLGIQHAPFRLEGRGQADLLLRGISSNRLENRRKLLASFDHFRRQVGSNAIQDGLDNFHQQAFGILTSSRLAKAFDLEREDPRVRALYGSGGSTTKGFGGAPTNPQMLLLARRLVEAGVRCVTVAFGAWDWHGNRGGPVSKLGPQDLPVFDHAIATLLEDLDQRGLTDDVTIVAWGEFGRTPRINAKGGRDHWTKTSCAFLAGGGMRTGQVIGETDSHAAEPARRPVHIQEVFATLYANLGIDVKTATVTDLHGRPHYLVDEDRQPIAELV